MSIDNKYLQSILDHLYDAVVTIDSDGTILTANPAAGSMFGYEAQEMEGKNINVIVPDSLKNAHANGLAQYVKTRKSNILGASVDITATHRDGTIFPVNIRINELFLGEVLSFVGIIRDVRQQKWAEDQLKQKT
jgi:PAS domain S-box-containing protein